MSLRLTKWNQVVAKAADKVKVENEASEEAFVVSENDTARLICDGGIIIVNVAEKATEVGKFKCGECDFKGGNRICLKIQSRSKHKHITQGGGHCEDDSDNTYSV